MPLRIVFMGTPDFSVPSLIELVGHGHEVVACYTQPPRPAGRRGLELKKSPVHEKAEQFGIPVFTPESLKGLEEQQIFAAHGADVAIVIAYGLLLPEAVLNAPEFGCYNGHASLLPRWRGAAPIQRAIMTGDAETGVNIMKMDVGLDTGPVALGERMAIAENMTAGELHDQLSALTADLMIRAMGALERGSLDLAPQPEEGVTYAHKISKEETRIDWAKPAPGVHNHIRGLSPFPGAWCEMEIGGKPQRVKILASRFADGKGNPGEILNGDLVVACEEGAVQLVRLQRAGKQIQDAEEFLRGNKIKAVS
ncbi:MAG: methionyl-tRNA formyltransferase [Pseudomonadota bacterium]